MPSLQAIPRSSDEARPAPWRKALHLASARTTLVSRMTPFLIACDNVPSRPIFPFVAPSGSIGSQPFLSDCQPRPDKQDLSLISAILVPILTTMKPASNRSGKPAIPALDAMGSPELVLARQATNADPRLISLVQLLARQAARDYIAAMEREHRSGPP